MININRTFTVIGVMSGTSGDGLDIACSRYYKKNQKWFFEILKAETFLYPKSLKTSFKEVFNKTKSLEDIDKVLGYFISEKILQFLTKNNLKIDLIGSHGHTIFHDPKNGYTCQIGAGSVISKTVNVPVVSNFRQQDIDLGGQGAPLVPIGDRLLFSEYEACLNLGGIANISFEKNGNRIGYDICPCNILLNFLAQIDGKEFDEKGVLASRGVVNTKLMDHLNNINYYSRSYPKSLGREDVDLLFMPLVDIMNVKIEDLLCTIVEHIALQIGVSCIQNNLSNILITGGGVYNDYLLERIDYHTNAKIVVPSPSIIEYKESIIFGFLAVLRILNKKNCLASTTGASIDHCSGDLYLN